MSENIFSFEPIFKCVSVFLSLKCLLIPIVERIYCNAILWLFNMADVHKCHIALFRHFIELTRPRILSRHFLHNLLVKNNFHSDSLFSSTVSVWNGISIILPTPAGCYGQSLSILHVLLICTS